MANEVASGAPEEKKQDGANQANEAILQIARDRFKLAEEAENHNRLAALNDLKFLNGDQWPEAIKRQRELEDRPVLTFNRLPQYSHQITNENRKNNPAIKVSAVDDKADPDTAKLFTGLIRHIEYSSIAKIAYTTAYKSAVDTGRGFFRLVSEYCDPYSFDQEVKIKQIRDRFTVYLDPSHQMPDGSDANWAFIFENVNHDDYNSQYGESKLSQMTDWTSIGDSAKGWITEKHVRICEYYRKEYVKIRVGLFLLPDGTKQSIELNGKAVIPQGAKLVKERDSKKIQVKWVKTNGIEILEETVLPGQYIPIIKVLGREVVIDGVVHESGFVRNAKDSQQMLNFWKTAQAEMIALAPKAPFIIEEGQIEGYESIWSTANRASHAYLPYKRTSLANGTPVPPPQRQTYEPPVQAMAQAGMQSIDDIKAATGMYDAGMGATSNETSGRAIDQRRRQVETTNYDFVDNLNISIAHLGRILLEWIPVYYDTARAVRILGEDGTEKVELINQWLDGSQEKGYFLSAGKYDVTVSNGPSFETKRQETVESMLEMARSNPKVVDLGGDILFKNMDWQNADKLAERWKKTLPPGIADDENGKAQPIPPQLQAQMAKQGEIIDILTQQLNEAKDKVDNKTIEIESKERIELQKIQSNMQIELAKINSKEGIELLNAEIRQIEHRLNLLHQQIPISNESTDEHEAPSPQINLPTDELSGPSMEA